ncbi:ATP-binding protein, partial [Acidobacteriota bacterium]
YTIRDGLQGYEFNGRVACKSDQGEMFFGGINGLNRFFPKDISDNERKNPPPVVITSLKKLGKEFKLDTSITHLDRLELSYKDDFISFEFAALSFSEPEKNRYAYKLDPGEKDNKDEKDWIYLGNKHDVDLINLEPGNYTFKVRGSNSDGCWNEEGTKIKIIVTPPFTKTLLFYIFLVVFVGGGISGFVGWRINNIHKTNRLLERVIGDRLRAEEKLRESEKLYRTLIETSPDAITLYDSDVQNGKTVMFNQQAAVLLGYTSVGEMLAEVKNVFDIIDEKDSEKAHKSIKEIINETAVNKNTEYTLRAKDGTPISVEINTSLIKDDDGKPRYLLSIARDISKRKEAEKKEKLHQKKSTQIERMASLGRLVSGVAHELNNPVASIKMNSEIFDRVWKDIVPVLDEYYKDKKDFSLTGIPYLDAKKRLADLIIGFMEGSQRIEKIIHDLRDFSRPDDPLTREPIDINKVIQSSVNLNNDLLQKSSKYFSLKLAKSLPLIIGNFQKLEQVFINLIRNACQALPDNDKYISIRSNYNKENKHVVITVKDGGEGIDGKNLKYVTDPFFTTRRDQGGTGLGLFISRQIIQDHNGSMNFQSEKGKGTTVMVSLPVNE